MTAEIVVMNREAVVMAADSAVTAGSKIYQSANKLFTLSKIHPVGMMISNAADFMGVPWETVVKMYRQETLDADEHATISDAAAHFLYSLNVRRLCPEDQQRLRVAQIVQDHLENVEGAAQQQWANKLIADGRCSNRQKGLIVKNLLIDYREFLRSLPDYQFQTLTERRLVTLYKAELNAGIEGALGALGLTKVAESIAFDCAKLGILKETSSSLSSTIAVAGFGSEEVFPSLEIFDLEGVIGDELKHTHHLSRDIDRQGHVSVIKPLAQGEMVHRFMTGVDDAYQEYLEDYFLQFCLSIGMNKTQAEKVADKYRDDLDTFRDEKFSKPIIRALVHLPKHDMARMAEALVSLTSLKRRVSSDELETVSDPIDVAVISKGDGFVWIKRKHYFSTDLNQHFVTQYLRNR